MEEQLTTNKTAFDVMMNASKQQALARKKQSAAQHSTSFQSTVARSAAALRQSNKEKQQQSQPTGETMGDWQVHTWSFFQNIIGKMKSAVGFNQRGKHELYGEWPAFSYSALVEPSSDPLNWYKILADEDEQVAYDDITKADFALPSFMLWAPELRWPDLYPEGRPKCPFHNHTSCVDHLGPAEYVRRCYGQRGNIGLAKRRYKCTIHERQGINPYCFDSTSKKVLDIAPDYVRGYWREHGFSLSHKGGISFQVLDQLRALLANGAGISGVRKSLVEAYKISHANQAKMWRGFTELCYRRSNKPEYAKRSLFFDFDDLQAEMQIPSLAYLVEMTLRDIESRIPYYTRKLQMVGGRNLAADHSHKVAKVVLIQSQRGFDGIYTVMNEFGKIVSFCFVNGTTLYEVEELLRAIDRRYFLQGFEGPVFFTTDRCCDEREFLSGTSNSKKTPIFRSFTDKYGNDVTTEGNGMASNDDSPSSGELLHPTRVLSLPCDPIAPQTLQTAEATAGDIIRRCLENKWKVIGYDSEWAIGPAAQYRARQAKRPEKNRGPDVITLCLPDGRNYLFELRLYQHKFPAALQKLIEDETLSKVANNISADIRKLREVNVQLRGASELGRIAKQRGIVSVANPGLSTVVYKLFGCQTNKNPSVRLSDWDTELNKEQKAYAAIDAYAHMFSYLKLLSMAFVDPINVPNPQLSALKQGTPVLLYTSNKSAVVASGVIIGEDITETVFGTARSHTYAKIRLAEGDIRQFAAIVPKGAGNRAFSQLFEETNEDFIENSWPIDRLRIKPDETEPHQEVTIVTETVMVARDADADEETGIPCEIEDNGSNQVSIDESIEDASRELLDLEHKGIKQDIEHIFLRFSRVLSKEHGAFRAFMARLSDAFFVPSQADIELVKTALRKCGLSEEEIKQKPWQYFKRRVRRVVPGSKVLLRDFKRVVNLFSDIKDGKTDQPLFGKKAWSLFKATVRHIHKGCLSDIPGESYYVQIGVDSMGIPLFKCIRGTSALEGFHQKIRQLIRGFNISPRYAIASLFEFIHRWNHDIDVRVLGLPRKYQYFYDGWEIEEDISIVSEWSEMDEIPHPHWINSTKDFVSTGETFGLNKAGVEGANGNGKTQNADSEDLSDLAEDPELEEEVTRLVDAMNDGTFTFENVDETVEDVICSSQVLSESAKWVGIQLGRSRTFGNVQTKTEEDFFQDNYHRFQNHEGSEADNFSSIAFGAFAAFWDQVIREEEGGERPKTDMTLKTAFHLQAYWKKFRRECNTATTLLPIHEENNALRRELRRGTGREQEVTVQPAQLVRDRQLLKDRGQHDKEGNAVFDDNDDAVFDDDHDSTADGGQVDDHEDDGNAMPADDNDGSCAGGTVSDKTCSTSQPGNRSTKRRAPRCKLCGHEYQTASMYGPYHQGRGKIGKNQLKPHDVCTVPEHERAKGFPLPDGKRMRRK